MKDTEQIHERAQLAFKKLLWQAPQVQMSREMLDQTEVVVDPYSMAMRNIVRFIARFPVAALDVEDTIEHTFHWGEPKNWFHHLRKALGLNYSAKYKSQKVIISRGWIAPDVVIQAKESFKVIPVDLYREESSEDE